MGIYKFAKEDFIKAITEMYPSEIHNGYIYVNSMEIVSTKNHWNHYIPLADVIDLAFVNNQDAGAMFMEMCNITFILNETLECTQLVQLTRDFFGVIASGVYKESPLLFLKYMLFSNHYSRKLTSDKYDLMFNIYAKNNSFGAFRTLEKRISK
jgi:hypothetical protein